MLDSLLLSFVYKSCARISKTLQPGMFVVFHFISAQFVIDKRRRFAHTKILRFFLMLIPTV